MLKKMFVLLTGIMLIIAGQGISQAKIVVTDQAPTYKPGTPTAISDPINTAWANAIAETRNTLSKYKDQKDLTFGFQNSGIYASQVATQNGYQGYDLFAVTVGTMYGVQLPSAQPGEMMSAFDDLKKKGDIYAGAAWQLWALQVGINSDFLLDGLYLGLKFGYTDISYDKYAFKTVVAGALANYQLIKAEDLGLGMILWRGISVGSGLVYEKNDTSYDLKLTKINQDITATDGQVIIDPSIRLGVNSYAVSIPVEISTAVRILYFLNLSAGLGLDLYAGSSSINIDGLGDTTVTGTPGASIQEQGKVFVNGGTDGDKPAYGRGRVMLGLGLGAGPVFIDVPLTYYLTSGFNVGVSLTVLW